ncbi:alpha/beta hydrolase [Thalassoglobus sp. JC818]|uniref:alpha/beta hydrolase n=1 Tax=Thalassoglobus sp. JC818 TaxID=3232136 RepID=UPI0034574D6B
MPLHPQAEAFLAAVAAQNRPGWEEMTPEEARTVFDGLQEVFGEGADLPVVRDETVGSGIRVRCYSPSTELPESVVLYFHGGGWVLGDLESHDSLCRNLCAASGVQVVSVDYRRPPEHRYPAAIDDCHEVFKILRSEPGRFGIDPSKIVIAGDSAGGNLAAAVALRAKAEGDIQPAAQVLIYPAIEPNFESDSYRQFGTGFGLTAANMQWFWNHYLGPEIVLEKFPYAALRGRHSLKGLPETFVVLAEYDVLHSEGQAFASSMISEGSNVQVKAYPGMLHGFVHFAAVFDSSREAIADMADFIQKVAQR